MAQKNATHCTYTYTSMLFCLVCLTTPSSLCPWVGWGLQCSPGPGRPLQAPPEFPPSARRDVTGPTQKAAGVRPSPGPRQQGGPREEDQEPSAAHLHPSCSASPQSTCCEPAAHGSPQGKPTNTLTKFCRGSDVGFSSIPRIPNWFPFHFFK